MEIGRHNKICKHKCTLLPWVITAGWPGVSWLRPHLSPPRQTPMARHLLKKESLPEEKNKHGKVDEGNNTPPVSMSGRTKLFQDLSSVQQGFGFWAGAWLWVLERALPEYHDLLIYIHRHDIWLNKVDAEEPNLIKKQGKKLRAD